MSKRETETEIKKKRYEREGGGGRREGERKKTDGAKDSADITQAKW